MIREPKAVFRGKLRFALLLCGAAPVFLVVDLLSAADSDTAFHLSDCNAEVPFCYLPGGRRSWPIGTGRLPKDHRLTLTARHDGKVAAQGDVITLSGLTISVSADGKLHVVSALRTDDVSLQLEVSHNSPDGKTKSQKLSVRRAPPAWPLRAAVSRRMTPQALASRKWRM